jgi:1-deoxy-D-xylulose 5-phosphate reductoisomerase
MRYFLEKKIKFLDIFKIVSTLLERQVFALKKSSSIEEILVWNREFRAKAEEFIQKNFK